MQDILTPISPGELLDKITILNIKLARISDADKLKNIRAEHTALSTVADQHIPETEEMQRLTAALQAVNEALWQIEDDIRDEERAKRFEAEFIRLARAVYVENDKRAALKKEINLALGSRLVEEKSYAAYD